MSLERPLTDQAAPLRRNTLKEEIAKPGSSSDFHMHNHKLQFAVAKVTVFEAAGDSDRYTAADLKNADGSIRVKYPWGMSCFFLVFWACGSILNFESGGCFVSLCESSRGSLLDLLSLMDNAFL
jgi:hypothetical protein